MQHLIRFSKNDMKMHTLRWIYEGMRQIIKNVRFIGSYETGHFSLCKNYRYFRVDILLIVSAIENYLSNVKNILKCWVLSVLYYLQTVIASLRSLQMGNVIEEGSQNPYIATKTVTQRENKCLFSSLSIQSGYNVQQTWVVDWLQTTIYSTIADCGANRDTNRIKRNENNRTQVVQFLTRARIPGIRVFLVLWSSGEVFRGLLH